MEENAVHMSQRVYRSVTRALSKGGYSKEVIRTCDLSVKNLLIPLCLEGSNFICIIMHT